MEDILTGFSTRNTPQTQKAHPDQAKNLAGGYSFQVSDMERLRRFLTLGSASGTYYVGASQLTRENAEVVLKLAQNEETHTQLVDTIVDISDRGAAPKNDYALFALAIAASHGSTENRQYALSRLSQVARTGTHLFLFATYVEQFRGWGRGLRRAVADWYTGKEVDRLAYQVVKYRQRGGWTHRDLLRLAHPKSDHVQMRSLFRWITQYVNDDDTPRLVEGFIKAQEPGEPNLPKLIEDYGLSWEMLPTEALKVGDVWEALLDNGLPQTALMRNLPRLTQLGIVADMGGRTAEIAARLTDTERLKRSRVHPINVLIAQRTYAAGGSSLSGNQWNPSRKMVDALDEAFYNAFGAVEPAGKRTMNALDVSGSMSFSGINNMPLTPREASAALALVNLATEPDSMTVGFTSGGGRSSFWDSSISPLNLSPRQRLDDAIDAVSGLPFGGTDCSLPMQYALERKLEVDTFVIYTDSETYAGRSGHPHQSLENYREKTGIDAKMIVVGMTATDSTIANPNDAGMLDIAGFDAAVPNLISNFSRGF